MLTSSQQSNESMPPLLEYVNQITNQAEVLIRVDPVSIRDFFIRRKLIYQNCIDKLKQELNSDNINESAKYSYLNGLYPVFSKENYKCLKHKSCVIESHKQPDTIIVKEKEEKETNSYNTLKTPNVLNTQLIVSTEVNTKDLSENLVSKMFKKITVPGFEDNEQLNSNLKKTADIENEDYVNYKESPKRIVGVQNVSKRIQKMKSKKINQIIPLRNSNRQNKKDIFAENKQDNLSSNNLTSMDDEQIIIPNRVNTLLSKCDSTNSTKKMVPKNIVNEENSSDVQSLPSQQRNLIKESYLSDKNIEQTLINPTVAKISEVFRNLEHVILKKKNIHNLRSKNKAKTTYAEKRQLQKGEPNCSDKNTTLRNKIEELTYFALDNILLDNDQKNTMEQTILIPTVSTQHEGSLIRNTNKKNTLTPGISNTSRNCDEEVTSEVLEENVRKRKHKKQNLSELAENLNSNINSRCKSNRGKTFATEINFRHSSKRPLTSVQVNRSKKLRKNTKANSSTSSPTNTTQSRKNKFDVTKVRKSSKNKEDIVTKKSPFKKSNQMKLLQNIEDSVPKLLSKLNSKIGHRAKVVQIAKNSVLKVHKRKMVKRKTDENLSIQMDDSLEPIISTETNLIEPADMLHEKINVSLKSKPTNDINITKPANSLQTINQKNDVHEWKSNQINLPWNEENSTLPTKGKFKMQIQNSTGLNSKLPRSMSNPELSTSINESFSTKKHIEALYRQAFLEQIKSKNSFISLHVEHELESSFINESINKEAKNDNKNIKVINDYKTLYTNCPKSNETNVSEMLVKPKDGKIDAISEKPGIKNNDNAAKPKRGKYKKEKKEAVQKRRVSKSKGTTKKQKKSDYKELLDYFTKRKVSMTGTCSRNTRRSISKEVYTM